MKEDNEKEGIGQWGRKNCMLEISKGDKGDI